MATSEPVLRLAVVGGGLFARDSHVPALLQLQNVIQVVAVWSHSKKSAINLAELLKRENIGVYYEKDENGIQSEHDKNYASLLARSDVDAVDLIVPIDVMPDYVEKALAAGKHVLSEKPVAPTIEIGKQMLARYNDVHLKNHPNLVWAIAEQVWFEPAWNHLLNQRERREAQKRRDASRTAPSSITSSTSASSADATTTLEPPLSLNNLTTSPAHGSATVSPRAQTSDSISPTSSQTALGVTSSTTSGSNTSIVDSSQGSSSVSPSSKKRHHHHSDWIGDPMVATLTRYIAMNQDNKYYSTQWRAHPTFQGGYLLDGGVHEVAKLRMILGEITTVTAVAHSFRPDLPPLDTLLATLNFKSGVLCNFTYSFAAASPAVASAHLDHDFSLIGSAGTLFASTKEVVIMTDSPSHPGGVHRQITHVDTERGLSIKRELLTFALTALRQPILSGKVIYTPVQALQDVIVLETILESAKTGQCLPVETLKELRGEQKRRNSLHRSPSRGHEANL